EKPTGRERCAGMLPWRGGFFLWSAAVVAALVLFSHEPKEKSTKAATTAALQIEIAPRYASTPAIVTASEPGSKQRNFVSIPRRAGSVDFLALKARHLVTVLVAAP